MAHSDGLSSNIDLKKFVQAMQLDELWRQLSPVNFGRMVYRQFEFAKILDEGKPINLCVPQEWLHMRWDYLHDEYQYLALQQPFAITLTNQAPPLPLERGVLRVLLTSGPLEDADIADDKILSEFEKHFNGPMPSRERVMIDLTIERDIRARDLFALIQTAQANNEPFHIWHHVGNTHATSAGLMLYLSDKEITLEVLQSFVKRLGIGSRAGLRLFLLHTPSATPSLLPALSHIPVPATIGLAMCQQSNVLLSGFYSRLLSNDVATALFLARLDCYISNPDKAQWRALEALSHTQPLQMVMKAWHAQGTHRSPQDEVPRFLFLRANPINVTHRMLSIDRELKRIKDALAYRRNEYAIRDEGALEVEDFGKLLLEMRPHLLHFSGHGTTRGSLVLEKRDGTKTYVQPERFSPLIIYYKQWIRCVILNACYSTHLSELLRPHGIVVIGMGDAVTDEAAIQFARGLYQAIAHGETLAWAFDLARGEISASGAVDEANLPQISDYELAKKIQFFKREGI